MYFQRMFSARYFNRCHNIISTAGNKILRKSPVIHNLQLSRVRALNTPNDIHQKQGSYEGPGKTTVSILNEEYAGVVNLIDSFAVDGFRLNDNTKILGPCVVFPTQVLCELTSRLIMGSSKFLFLSMERRGPRGYYRRISFTLHYIGSQN